MDRLRLAELEARERVLEELVFLVTLLPLCDSIWVGAAGAVPTCGCCGWDVRADQADN